MDTIQISARLKVDLPPADAMRLFTPEGERIWAEGWDPRYPSADGSVWLTGEGARETVWVTVESNASRVRYARVAPETAGTVTVEVVPPADPGATTVEVTYALDALDDVGRVRLADFQAGFPAYIAGWETDIREALTD